MGVKSGADASAVDRAFGKTTEISAVSVVFDTDLSDPATSKEIKLPGVPFCVKDYDAELCVGDSWCRFAEECGDFMRRSLHHFDPVTADRIRITVYATWGDPSARITEVHAWRSPVTGASSSRELWVRRSYGASNGR